MKCKQALSVVLSAALMLLAGCSMENYIVPGTDRRPPKHTEKIFADGDDVRTAQKGDTDEILPPVEYDDTFGELTGPPDKEKAPVPDTKKTPEESVKSSDQNEQGSPQENSADIPGIDPISVGEELKDYRIVTADVPPLDKTTVKSFTQAPEGYFKDALFIGDSRMVGLSMYGNIEGAYWFCSTGMSVFSIDDNPLDVEGIGKIGFYDLLRLNKFTKVYICLGINECGYGTSSIKSEYKKIVDLICEEQPDAPVFILANIHLAAARSDTDRVYNNKKLNDINSAIAENADNIQRFYVDVNEIFDDEKGYLRKDLTADSTHIFAKHYPKWTDYLKSHAIVP